MDNIVMADSIAYVPEFQAWYAAIQEVISDVDLSKLLVYKVDDVDSDLLQFLADQFDVLGYNGMRLALTEADQRSIIKRAIELHKYKGTEWAIEQALLSIGFANVVLKGGIAAGYDHWAKFGIDVTNSGVQLTASSYTDIIQMVNNYKRAVCVLQDVSLNILVNDTLTIDDIENEGDEVATCLPAITAEDNLFLSGILHYDGTAIYNGDNDYSGDTDVAEIT